MPRALRRRSLEGLGLAITLAACGSSPSSPMTSPTLSPLPFVQGGYVLTLTGYGEFEDANGQLQPGCGGSARSGLDSTIVATGVTMSLEAGVWVGRPTTALGGSFELTFALGPEGPGAPGGGPGVAVMASGVVLNTIPNLFLLIAWPTCA